MDIKQISEMTNDELVETVGKTVLGTTSGLKSQHAQAELTKRLIKSIDSLNISTTKYSERLVGLTIVLLVVGFMQIFVSLESVSSSSFNWLLLGIITLVTIILITIIAINNKAKTEE